MSAFQASYSDWRVIKTRKVIQIVLELPLEHADSAYQVLGGMPRPDAEVWVAVARLQSDRAETSPPEKGEAPACINAPRSALPPRRLTSLPLPEQAGIICNQPAFQKFILKECNKDISPRDYILNECEVNSRSEIEEDTLAAIKFRRIRDRYLAWKVVS